MPGWIQLAGAVITALSAIAVALISARANKDRKQEAEEAEARKKKEAADAEKRKAAEAEAAARRERESRLSMEMMSASIDLGIVTSLAVTGGHINGNVEAAQKKAQKAKAAYEAFLRDEAAHAVASL